MTTADERKPLPSSATRRILLGLPKELVPTVDDAKDVNVVEELAAVIQGQESPEAAARAVIYYLNTPRDYAQSEAPSQSVVNTIEDLKALPFHAILLWTRYGVQQVASKEGSIVRYGTNQENFVDFMWRVQDNMSPLVAFYPAPVGVHFKCDCVPDQGPEHCHLCGDDAGRPMAWVNAHPSISQVSGAYDPSDTFYQGALEALSRSMNPVVWQIINQIETEEGKRPYIDGMIIQSHESLVASGLLSHTSRINGVI